MKKILYVGVGGAAGTFLRYAVLQIPLPSGTEFRPLLTMFINISGSFLLGCLMVLFEKAVPVSAAFRVGITTGLLGGYTTFSTMCKDSVLLWTSQSPLFSAAYLAASVFLGLAAARAGMYCAKHGKQRRRA